MKVTKTDEKLPEIAMEESRKLLDRAMPFFYFEEGLHFDTDRLECDPVEPVESLAEIARFFDKFDLGIGKVALAVHLPYVVSRYYLLHD